MKFMPKEKETYMANGIDYILHELPGLAQPLRFVQHKEIPIINEEIEP